MQAAAEQLYCIRTLAAMTSIDERTGLVKLYNSKQEREVVEQYAGGFFCLYVDGSASM